MSGWSTPFLSVLKSADKDALQQIFTSLEAEITRLNRRIDILEGSVQNPNKYKERKVY
jgi:hypothetical protein